MEGFINDSIKLELIASHRKSVNRLGQTEMTCAGLSPDAVAEEHSIVWKVTQVVFISPCRCCGSLEEAMEWGIPSSQVKSLMKTRSDWDPELCYQQLEPPFSFFPYFPLSFLSLGINHPGLHEC